MIGETTQGLAAADSPLRSSFSNFLSLRVRSSFSHVAGFGSARGAAILMSRWFDTPLGVRDVDVQERISLCAGRGRGVLGDRHLQQVAADKHGLGRLPSGDHVRVVDAEVLPFDEKRRLLAALRRLAMPAQERRTEAAWPCEQKIRESLWSPLKGTRTARRWVGMRSRSCLMRSIAI